jgi:hypothetical protein
MGQAIPQQHPAVVLRSHYAQVRNLLAVAMIGLVGLSGAVVILANDQDELSGTTAAKPAQPANPVGSPRYFEGVQESTSGIVAPQAPGTRFDGGPEEGTRGIVASPPAPSSRYDGGPEEGTRGLVVSPPAPSSRYDGGPEEGTRDIAVSPLAPSSRYDGGPEEGTRGIASGAAAQDSPTAPGFNTD